MNTERDYMNETKELLKDIIAGLVKLVEENKLAKQDRDFIAGKIEELKETNEVSLKKIKKELNEIFERLPELKTIFPDKFSVEVLNPVKEVEVKKPSWYKPFRLKENLFDPLIDFLGGLVNRVFKVKIIQEKRNANDYLVVRLSDGKEFYKAEGGGGMVAFGGPDNVGLKDSSDNRINPATADKQDSILAQVKNYGTNDIEEASSTITYVGKEDADGREGLQEFETC